jgi:hypothetical protein
MANIPNWGLGDEGEDPPKPTDPRIRMVTVKFRVVAPGARANPHGTCWVNQKLVVEKVTRDSLGVEQWSHVLTLVKGTEGVMLTSEDVSAIFHLLAGDAQDA